MEAIELLKTLSPSSLILIIVVFAWFLNQFWKDKSRRMHEETKVVAELSLAVVELRVEIKHLNEVLQDIPKMRQDINAAFLKIRDLEN